MKYQKSMMKILEVLLLNKDKDVSIEECIRQAGTGRSSSFEALGWLSQNSFVKIQSLGNQKRISPVIDNYTLQFKYYLDTLEFKTKDPFTKFIVRLFVKQLSSYTNVKAAVLFKDSTKESKSKSIDLLVLGQDLDSSTGQIAKESEKLKKIFGVPINFHFENFNLDTLFRGIVIYQASYVFPQEELHNQFEEFLNNFIQAIESQKNKGQYSKSFNNALLNLANAYCILNSLHPATKSDALELFNKSNHAQNLEQLKQRGIEIGEKIFN